MAVAVTRRRFTIDDYQRMEDAGILRSEDRVELIDGEFVTRVTAGPRHHASVDCYSSPERGAYRVVRQYTRGQSLAPQLLFDCLVPTSELLVE